MWRKGLSLLHSDGIASRVAPLASQQFVDAEDATGENFVLKRVYVQVVWWNNSTMTAWVRDHAFGLGFGV